MGQVLGNAYDTTKTDSSERRGEMEYEYLKSRFQTLDVLGESGKGSTCLAKDHVTGDLVVLKYISKERAAVYQRLASLEHRNLVHIFYIAEGEKDVLVVMEYVSGKALEDYLEEKGILAGKEALEISKQLAEGLCAVHQLNLIHRDLNPNNILRSSDGVVKIIDFDIGRVYKEQQGRDTEILGTAGYAAPEQFGFSQSDVRTDLYSVGVVLNVMLTGKFPYERCFKEGKLGRIVKRCTRIDPELRFQTAEELLEELSFVNPEGTTKLRDIIPGFRTGVKWKQRFARDYYIVAAFLTVGQIMACSKTLLGAVLETIAVLLYLWVSVLGACNFLDWMDCLLYFHKGDKDKKEMIGLIFWIVMYVWGTMLENFVKDDLLHLNG